MKYNVGDIVKLRDDLEVDKFYKGIKFIYEMERLKHLPIELLKHEIFDNCYKVEDYNGKDYIVSEAMIERLWKECKSSEQVSKSEGKYKLIDILNKIANGELKEGTKVKWDIFEYTYKKGDCYDEYLERKVDKFDYVDIIDDMALRHLNTEVELIEPYHFTDVGKMAEHIREDTKMIEPTDNTKIEELDVNALTWNDLLDYQKLEILFDKLNEVIRKLNWVER